MSRVTVIFLHRSQLGAAVCTNCSLRFVLFKPILLPDQSCPAWQLTPKENTFGSQRVSGSAQPVWLLGAMQGTRPAGETPSVPLATRVEVQGQFTNSAGHSPASSSEQSWGCFSQGRLHFLSVSKRKANGIVSLSPHCPGPTFPDSLFCCYLLFLVLFALSCSPACLLALTLSSTSPSWSTQESPSCGYTSHCFRLTPAETLQEAEMLGLVTKRSPTWCQQPIRVHLGRQVWVSGVRRFWGSKEGWAQWWL